MKANTLTPIVFFLAVLLWASNLFACPKVAGFPDFNCDGKAKLTVTGDSIVYGQGDSVNSGVGGYVKRFKQANPQVDVRSLGVTAITTRQLLRKYKQSGSTFMREAKGSDIVVIDLGRNDCRSGNSSANSVTTLKRLAKVIRERAANAESSPFVVLATSIPNRNYRRPCIEALNRRLLQASSASFPVVIRFDRLTSGILSGDGLHPTSNGYETIVAAFKRFISRQLPKLVNRERPDADADGIYDYFETLRYRTDPALFDTDGDGEGDGREVFELKTDPLIPNAT
jgi:lysophospholipase L1-like esterase